MAVLVGAAGGQFLGREAIVRLLPALLLGILLGTGYMFAAGMVLFEQSERTLSALSVSPLSPHDYIGSKLVTLCGFAAVESAIFVGLALGPRGVKPLPLGLGVLLLGAIFTLMGLAQAIRYRSITDFLVPTAMLAGGVAQLPVIHILGIWPHPLWYIFPTLAPMLLIKGAVAPLARWEWVYAVTYSVAAAAFAYRAALRQLRRHGLRSG